MVVNQGRKRAAEKRKTKRKQEKKKAAEFGIISTDSKGNKRISFE